MPNVALSVNNWYIFMTLVLLGMPNVALSVNNWYIFMTLVLLGMSNVALSVNNWYVFHIGISSMVRSIGRGAQDRT